MHSELSSQTIFTRTSIVHRTFCTFAELSSFRTYINTYASRVPRRSSRVRRGMWRAARSEPTAGSRSGSAARHSAPPRCRACRWHAGSRAYRSTAAHRLQECLPQCSNEPHVGTARKSRCRSSASMAMAAIEAGDRQEMVPEGLGALLCSLALAADGPFEAAAGQPWQQGFFRADLPPPAHHCDREHGSEPSEAQIRAHGRFDRDLPAATAGPRRRAPAMTAPFRKSSSTGEKWITLT